MGFERRWTRRSAQRSIGAAGLGLASGTALAAETLSGKRATEFALVEDNPHNPDYIPSALTTTLARDAELSIDFADEEKTLSYESFRHYKIVIMFRDGPHLSNGYWNAMYWNGRKNSGEGRVGWMTGEQGKGIRKWVEEGVPLSAFHNNSQASMMNKDYCVCA